MILSIAATQGRVNDSVYSKIKLRKQVSKTLYVLNMNSNTQQLRQANHNLLL